MSLFNRRNSTSNEQPSRAPATQPLYPRPLPPIVHTSPHAPAHPYTSQLGDMPASLENILAQARYWHEEAIRLAQQYGEATRTINHAETVRLIARKFLWGYARGMDLSRIRTALGRMRPDTGLPLNTTAGDLLELINALDLESEATQ